MKRGTSRLLSFAIGFSLFMAVWTQGFAAEKTPFYQGKTLNFVINFGAGGPTDIESRIFAKHLAKHIPGQPSITVQNMGGGGGLTAVNYLGEVVKPDGYTAAYFTGSLFQHQLRIPPCASISVNLDSSPVCTASPYLIFAQTCRLA
jgi:tripartite-type tricarboxylate transporter receptor subunit TctC